MQPTPSLRLTTVLALATFALALGLWLRWEAFYLNFGSVFIPRPDSVEYVAGAQSIVQHGRFFLQIGPYEVRSRYPPGLSMLLAAPLAAGVPAEELWRFKAVAGPLIAWLLGWWVALVLRRWGLSEGLASLLGAAAIAHWLFLPLNLAQANMVMADEPALLLGLVMFGILAPTWSQAAASQIPRLGLAGFVAGLLWVTRGTTLVLMAPLFLPWVWQSWRQFGIADGLRRVAYGLGGALPWLVAASWLLWRSGFPPFQMTAYGFWVPESFTHFSETFHWQWALRGNPLGPLPGGTVAPHLLIGTKLLGGWPSFLVWEGYGWIWPGCGGLAGIALLALEGRADWATRRWLIGGAALVVAHWVFYGFYAYPGGRFYLPAMALLLVAFWLGVGWLVQRGGLGRWAGTALGCGLALGGCWAPITAGMPHFADWPDSHAQTRQYLQDWLDLPEEVRERRLLAADTVVAQALGLLPPTALGHFRLGGPLAATPHVRRLVDFGHLDRAWLLGPNADRRYLHLSPYVEPRWPGSNQPNLPLLEDDFESGDLRYWSQRVDAHQRTGW